MQLDQYNEWYGSMVFSRQTASSQGLESPYCKGPWQLLVFPLETMGIIAFIVLVSGGSRVSAHFHGFQPLGSSLASL